MINFQSSGKLHQLAQPSFPAVLLYEEGSELKRTNIEDMCCWQKLDAEVRILAEFKHTPSTAVLMTFVGAMRILSAKFESYPKFLSEFTVKFCEPEFG